MFATLLTLAFATAALFVLATLGASLAKGLAVAAALRGESAGASLGSPGVAARSRLTLA